MPDGVRTLKSRGVTFEPPEVLDFPWGYAARFEDPDGNLLQVREGRGAFDAERNAFLERDHEEMT
ncbi:hypothetical protein RFM99_09215 [Mesorhizobium sp. VK4C]|uniref:hypothetical protein n=1 Tax=Mesorhizobium captivum TaxID=3072319 RepID=UPI002A23A9C2|nr:hypothetical protein [Mesorhizobium sp. VK4C]MDX8498600.1 hypothetical protein [Mesorhizobium sp. VK4C]